MSITSTDPIADMLSRVRNAIAVNKNEIELPHSKIKEAVAQILKNCGFISDIKVAKADVGKTLSITINPEGTNAKITEIVRLSKPGRRYYVKSNDIPVVKRGRGMIVVSTSKGLMTDTEARNQHLGGELICKVY